MSKRVRKWSTWITDQNGGMDSPVNYRKARQMLLNHPYRNGRLYHIVLTHSEDRKVYRYVVDQLCKQLRAKGMPCRWKACYERDKMKRFHMHIMILVEAHFVNPDSVIHFKDGDWLTELTKRKGVKFTIAPPDDAMHLVGGKQVNYMYVPKKVGPRLEDALIRISYLYKVRSKEGVEGQIYTGSTNIEDKPSLSSAASPAAEEIEQIEGNHETNATQELITPLGSTADHETESSDQGMVDAGRQASASQEGPSDKASPINGPERYGSEGATTRRQGTEMTLTASQKYIGMLYEFCVDRGMDIEEIRKYMLEHGVPRTPAQVVYELDEVYEFHQYAASHPAKQLMSVQLWDKAAERGLLNQTV